MNALLDEKQVNLAAQYFAVSNTGLIGILVDKPQNEADISGNYDRVDYEYANETGEGLEEELQMWEKDMKKLNDSDSYYFKTIKEEIPFILEGE